MMKHLQKLMLKKLKILKQNKLKIFKNHLRNRILLFNFFLFFLLLCGCNSTNKLKCNNVQGIKIAYLPKGINPNKAISNCDDIFDYSPVLMDTTITNKEIICKFINLANEFVVSNDSSNKDFRIICLIFVNGSEKPTKMCFGEDNLIFYNEIQMNDNIALFNLLDTLLYRK